MFNAERPRYAPIADYALIGNCRSAALVSRAGSVDWWCPGRFDAAAVLCRLLDADRGGSFWLAPEGGQVERRYVDDTNVLETIYCTPTGLVRVTDFMPIDQPTREGRPRHTPDRIVRSVEAEGGEVRVRLELLPSFDYARSQHEVSMTNDGAIARAGECFLTLNAPSAQLASDGNGGIRGEIIVQPGERRWVALTSSDDEQSAHTALTWADGTALLKQTLDYWRGWSDSCAYRGPYRDAVLRSALVLKLLTYEPTGAVIAAPSTSLPEAIGGVRNWDYRYTWLRDASLMLYSLLTVGYYGEAADFFEWLERVEQANPGGVPRIMYTIDGGREIPEQTLDHLEGYRGSRPVRIGNAAAEQRQLDVFGEVLGSAYLYFSHVDPAVCDRAIADEDGRPSANTWRLLSGLVEQAGASWSQPDRGIWEVRGEPKLFLYSRLRCWAAVDRGIKLAQRFGLRAPIDRWHRVRDEIRASILSRGYDAEMGAFTQAFGSKALDASSLVIPRIGFLPATDPRVQSTVARTRAALTRNGLVDRYLNPDGVPGGEASFAMCTYWLADALALGGQIDEAHAVFERVTGYANDLGLLSEEIDPSSGDLLGNFPQGFSHMALIGTAVNLAKTDSEGPETESTTEAGRVSRAKRAGSEDD